MRTTKANQNQQKSNNKQVLWQPKQYTAGFFFNERNKIGKLNITTTQFIFAEMG